jgi:hypothetical protein
MVSARDFQSWNAGSTPAIPTKYFHAASGSRFDFWQDAKVFFLSPPGYVFLFDEFIYDDTNWRSYLLSNLLSK